MNRSTKKAFTIVELVIVIAVIAVLAAVLIPTFGMIITNAEKAADEAEIASLNVQLATTEIKTEADIYKAITEVYGAKAAEKFAPETADKGYHYWYDVASKTVIFKSYEELDEISTATAKADTFDAVACAAPAPAAETGVSFADAHKDAFRMFYVNGRQYYLLDKGGSAIGDALTALDPKKTDGEDKPVDGDDIRNKLIEVVDVKDSALNKNNTLADKLLDKLSEIAIVSDAATFVYDANRVNTVYFVPGTEKISSNVIIFNKIEGNDTAIAKQENLKTNEDNLVDGNVQINLPDNVGKIEENALIFDGETKVQIKTQFTDTDSVKEAFHANSTNGVIIANEKEYTVNDSALKEGEDVVGSLAYTYVVENFDIFATEDYAEYVDAQKSVYVPYDKGYVTLYTVVTDEKVSSDKMTWSIAEDANGILSVDQNGKVTFNSLPESGSLTATVRATAQAGGATRDIKVRLVAITDMTVTINNEEVNLMNDNPYVDISYTGDADAYNITVDGFAKNYDICDCDTTVTYEYSTDIFTIANGKLTLKKDANGKITEGERAVTIKVGPKDNPYLESTVFIEIFDDSSEPFVPAFAYVNDFVYRVGNKNAITLGTLFTCEKAPETFTLKIKDKGAAAAGSGVLPEIGTVTGSSFNATYTLNSSDWKASTIKFTGVGIAVIEIDGVDLLTLEVVNGTNYTAGQTLPTAVNNTTGHIALLGNVTSATTMTMNNKCLFGNGFVVDAKNASNTAIGIITLNNGAMLDNVIITGSVYTTYEGNSGNGQTWSTSLVFVNNGIISNSYLSNTKSPVRAAGSVTIINSTISGGCYANIDVHSSSELTLEDVTFINQIGNKQPTDKALGLGVVVHQDAAEASIIIKGSLKQYNLVGNSHKTYLPSGTSALDDYWSSIMSVDSFTINDEKYIDTGIFSISAEVGTFLDYIDADQSVRDARVYKDVTGGRYIYHLSTAAGPGAYDATYSYANTWQENGYKPNKQGAIPPNYSLLLTTTKPDASAKEYCYIDGSTIKIGFESGGSKTLTLSSEVFNITNSLGDKLDLKYITLDGTAISDTYTFTKAGPATLKVGVESEGQIYYYTLSVNVAITSYPNGSVSLSSSTVTIHGSTSKDYYIVFDILAGVTIKDVDVNGQTRTETINNTLPAGWTISLDDTGYIVTITTSWDNVNGEKTKLVITASASGTGAPTNWELDCDKDCPANSLHSCYQKAKNNSVTPTATYVYYGFNGNASASVTLKGSTSLDNNAKHTVSSGCVTPDTLVTLADGTQKEIQYVTYEDQLLVWNFYTGEYDVAYGSIVMNHGYGNYDVVTLKFDDGTEISTINGHGFFDSETKEYVIIESSNVDEYIGHSFIKVDGDKYTTVTLLNYTIENKYTESWSILTAEHYNCILEGLWTLTPAEVEGSPKYLMPYVIGERMKYDESAMQADIDTYGLYTYDEFAEYCTYEQFVAFGLENFKVSVAKGYITFEDIIYLLNIHTN